MERWTYEQTVDLSAPTGAVIWPDMMMVEGDNEAHLWRVHVTDCGAPVDMGGCTVTAYFDRSDGLTVPVAGTADGSMVSVVLPQAVCASPGNLLGVMRASSGNQTITLAVGRGVVRRGPGDEYVDPGHIVPSLTELLAQIDAMEQATTAANSAAAAANELVSYNAANLATDWVKYDSELNGVRWTFEGDTVTASGTVNGVASFVRLNGADYSLPSWMQPGETYHIRYASQGISLLIYDMSAYATDGTMPLIFSTMQDAVFTVPGGVSKCQIRLWLPSGATVQETVQLPKFLTAPSNKELAKSIEKMATKKGILPDGTDLNSVMEPGAYVLNSTHDYINSPRPKGWGGVLEVWEAHDRIILQRLTYVDANIQDVRVATLRSFDGHAWNEIGGNTVYLLPSTNDTTDRTGDIQTLLNTTGACHLGSGVFYVTGITIPTGGMLSGSGKGTRLVLADSVTDGYAVRIGTYGTVQDMSICGAESWAAKASGITNDVGTRDGLIFEGLASTSGAVPYRSTVEAVMFYNLSGSAIRCENTGYNPASCLNVSDVHAFWCGCGVNIAYWSEFNRFTNVNADNCGYGCINNGGNNVFVNCAFNSNNVGILMDNSTGQSRNNSHGTFAGCSINHSGGNTGTAIRMVGMENGQIFSACQIFYGKIVIDRCVGVRFVGANIGRQVPMEITNSTVVVFDGCNMYDNDASPLTQSGNTELKFTGCRNKDGSVFDPMAQYIGFSWDGEGVVTPSGVTPSAAITYTEYIPVIPHKTYVVDNIYSEGIPVLYYDESKAYISSCKCRVQTGATQKRFAFRVPEKVRYIRFNATIANRPNVEMKELSAVDIVENEIYFTIEDTGILLPSGEIIASSAVSHTDYINVSLGGNHLCIEKLYPAYKVSVILYDENKKFLSLCRTKASDSTISKYEFDTPTNCAYIRFNVTTANVNNAKLYYLNKAFDNSTSEQKNFVTDFLSATRNQLVRPFEYIKSIQPMCVIIDDDTLNMYQVEKFHEVCTKNGIVGTMACITNYLDTIDGLEDTLLEYEKQGFQTIVHCSIQTRIYDYRDSMYDPVAMQRDFINACHRMEKAGFYDWKYWAYPYGLNNEVHRSLARKTGMKCAMTVADKTYFDYSNNRWRYSIPRMELYPTDTDGNQTLADIKTKMLECVQNKGLLIVCTHMYQWQEGVHDFSRIDDMISFGKQAGLHFVTLGEAMSYWESVLNLFEVF